MSVAIKENRTKTRVVKAKRLTPLEKEKIKEIWNDLQGTFLANDVGIVLYLSSKFKQPRKNIENIVKEIKNEKAPA